MIGSNQMRRAKNPRRALLVLSDGNDNNSRFSESEVKGTVIERDVQIFAIALHYRPRLLKQLADATGGTVLLARDTADLDDVVRQLSVEIRSHYLLGYASNNRVRDGKYRKVKVELLRKPGDASLRVSWRRGYYAPAD